MVSFDDRVVQARRDGVSLRDMGKELSTIDSSVSIEDVTHAFALAGYPPSDTIVGVSAYMMGAGTENAENFQGMIDAMRGVGFPEHEIQDALNQAKG